MIFSFSKSRICSRQESMYAMTGLYSETADDSSIDVPADSENSDASCPPIHDVAAANSSYVMDTVIKCHSRQPSTGIIDQRDRDHDDDLNMSMVDCGILTCRPKSFQQFARIKVSFFSQFRLSFSWPRFTPTITRFWMFFFCRFLCYCCRCW